MYFHILIICMLIILLQNKIYTDTYTELLDIMRTVSTSENFSSIFYVVFIHWQFFYLLVTKIFKVYNIIDKMYHIIYYHPVLLFCKLTWMINYCTIILIIIIIHLKLRDYNYWVAALDKIKQNFKIYKFTIFNYYVYFFNAIILQGLKSMLVIKLQEEISQCNN